MMEGISGRVDGAIGVSCGNVINEVVKGGEVKLKDKLIGIDTHVNNQVYGV